MREQHKQHFGSNELFFKNTDVVVFEDFDSDVSHKNTEIFLKRLDGMSHSVEFPLDFDLLARMFFWQRSKQAFKLVA